MLRWRFWRMSFGINFGNLPCLCDVCIYLRHFEVRGNWSFRSCSKMQLLSSIDCWKLRSNGRMPWTFFSGYINRCPLCQWQGFKPKVSNRTILDISNCRCSQVMYHIERTWILYCILFRFYVFLDIFETIYFHIQLYADTYYLNWRLIVYLVFYANK